MEKLRSRHGVDVQVGRPQVAYRETISRSIEIHHVHKKQTGGPGQFADVALRFEPLARGEGIRFDSRQMKNTSSPMKMIGDQLKMNGSMCDHHDGSGGAAAASARALEAAAAACCVSNQDS